MEENKPKLTVSGYRGIWGKDLNEEIAFLYARAFAKLINKKIKFGNEKKKIIIGHDSRKSASQILPAIFEALNKENIEPVYAGLLPTPSVLLTSKEKNFDGGIIITASHNPSEYNGLKFVISSGKMSDAQEISDILEEYNNLTDEEKKYQKQNLNFTKADNKEFRELHIKKIIENIDADLIRKKKFRVALDPINSAGAIITKELLTSLGCEIFSINDNPEEEFARPPEPLAENLLSISHATKANNCNIGFAQDPDADRLVLVDENGQIISEELTICLATESVFQRSQNIPNSKKIVVNLSTTKLIEDIAEKYHARVSRSKVGEANVVEKMLSIDAQIGGEGSGGIIFPPVGYMRDSLIGIGLILELMATKDKTISQIIADYPKYYFKKEKVKITGNPEPFLERLKNHFVLLGDIDHSDGVRIDFSDKSWVQIRPSNTEPILRIFGEALTEERLGQLFEEIHLTLGLK